MDGFIRWYTSPIAREDEEMVREPGFELGTPGFLFNGLVECRPCE